MDKVNPSDAMWKVLLDEDTLTKRRGQAEDKYRDWTGVQIEGLRKRAKTDLMFLAGGILEYDLLSIPFHGHFARWMWEVRYERYKMSLLARDHYKSTIKTITESIQMVLPNDAGVDHYPHLLGPNIKMLIAHEVRESASRFLYEITKAFREKLVMLALFPELIPSPRVQRMNKWELELPREIHHREPTFDTMGVGGAAQGRHYNWLMLDDLVGEDARDSETVMKRVLLWFDNINSLLTRLKIDGWDLIGTRWAPTDVYSHAVKMYGVKKERSVLYAYDERDIETMEPGQLVVYARGAIENGLPVFPEEFSLEDLNRIRKNPYVWAAQYANNPREGDLTRLKAHWLKYYNIGNDDYIIVFDGEGSRRIRTSELDRCILIDPAVGESNTADPWGIVVTGTDKDMNIYILEAYRKHMLPPDGIDEMFRLYTKWNPRLISIESVAFSAMLKYWFDQTCQRLGIYPSIYDYKPGSKRSKVGRIEGLSNYGAAGQIYILEGMHQLRDEWEWFPLGENDHILDALAQGPEVWAPGRADKLGEAMDVQKAVNALIEERCDITGYSSID